ncbi:Protein kinase domain [uncultured Clostridium sp.]|uniref:CFI-box-CTERM domain-containing protein n=1 Tax=uncultured Clostridium sp. TaxID=59620 RepID=UPI0008229A1E|nr:CFI-box-CTERM domain-containing protein [uncultured Clostridium sp.]SCK04461.1 Protein kinase domain [uncultured Clostridium sp.]
MRYRFGSKGELNINSTNCNLKNRWVVLSPSKMEEICVGNWRWFYSISNRRDERTNLSLGYDDNIGKPVIVKTIEYRANDLKDEISIRKRRSVLIEQVNILNALSSPLLPEPLDWFYVNNNYDRNMSKELRESEPVLILDFEQASTLTNEVNRHSFRYRNYNDVTKNKIDSSKVARLGLSILNFLRLLKEKNYAYLALSPEHILLLKDYVPRFVGLGRICKLRNGHLDSNHINFGRTLLGYSAPELNNKGDNWGEFATSEEVGAFSLGVILHQIIIESDKFEENTLKSGSFFYPNGVTESIIKNQSSGKVLHRLISSLCDHNPKTRLVDYDYIEEILKSIDLGKGREVVNKNGVVKEYNSDLGIGKIIDNNGREFSFYKNSVDKKLLSKLESGRSVIFSRVEYDDLITISEVKDTISIASFKRIELFDDVEIISNNNSTKPQYPNKPKKDGWCFISTAAYGTLLAPKLDLLRWYRDNVLIKSNVGRRSLELYFRYSPNIANKLRGMHFRKYIIRSIVDFEAELVKKIKKLSNSSIQYSLLAGSIFIIYILIFILAYIFVIPEMAFNIETTASNGENE